MTEALDAYDDLRTQTETNGNPNVNNVGVVLVTRECTYPDFVKCQPLNFKVTKGVAGLTRWIKKMETVFHISNCPPRTVGVDNAYAMAWKALMKLMTKVPQEEDRLRVEGNAIKNADNKRRNNVERKAYVGTLPYCNKCKMHHEGPCMVKCGNCKRVGHMTRDYKAAVAATVQRAPVRN
ncbi:hypothetical protein Tco_0573060 [Tanacetum coccineum]